jgi:hypothetical protein
MIFKFCNTLLRAVWKRQSGRRIHDVARDLVASY